jgi:hypothetical protein
MVSYCYIRPRAGILLPPAFCRFTQLNNLILALDAVVFSRMIGTFTLLFSSMSDQPVKNLDQSTINASKRNQNPSKRFDFASDIELNTLSAAMDRLYVWEKRLHKEVMVCYFH